MKRVVLAALVIMFFPACSFAYCSEPSAPSCASRYGEFDDQDDFDRCKRQMNSYKSEVEDFLSCQRNESQNALDEYNNAVARFNRRARG